MAEVKEKENKMSLFNWFGLGILAVSYFIAIFHMIGLKQTQYDPNTIVIRLTHWQLEAGIREGLDHMARKFEKQYEKETGKKVKVVQNAISEKAYRQYVQTQCIGRTAPDLIEIGMYDQNYTQRFFLTNSEDIKKPNPYNKGTPLEGIPWADTYIDGMQGSLDRTNLEYYGAGLSTVSVRIFYNKKLFKEVLGHVNPPRNFAEFMSICKKFKEWAEKSKKEDFATIAGAKYQLNLFRGRFVNSLMHRFGMRMDEDYNGSFNTIEAMNSYLKGKLTFDEEEIKSGYKMLAGMTKYFPTGFMAQDRMESGFRFTQGKAAFITSGSWDAMSFFNQADFPVGVFDFPLPAKDDPEYGKYVTGRVSEASFWSGLRFGITKFSKHPDVALKFLQFMTNAENNEEFSKICKWIPLIKGAMPHPVMEPFIPNPKGFWNSDPMIFDNRGRCKMVYDQSLWEFVEHKTDFETFINQLKKKLPKAIAIDLQREYNRVGESLIQNEVPISWQLANATFSPTWTSISEEQRNKLLDKAKLKCKYLMENKSRLLNYFYYFNRFNEHVAKKLPLAQKVRENMTIEFGSEKD